MAISINSAAATGFTDEPGVKNTVNPSFQNSEAAAPELGAQAVPKPDKADGEVKFKKSGAEDGASLQKASREVRKFVLEDGKLTINVYDSSGKLLRKTPPGYLPAGEQGFDITV